MSPSESAVVPSSAPFGAVSKQSPSIKPNPHPYAIKTTSSGLLTRSNSTSQNTQSSRHFYVPPRPSPGKGVKEKTSPGESSPVPRPLPTPPDHISPSRTTPVNGSFFHDWSTTKESSDSVLGAEVISVSLDDLPSNPKVWTPSQLSSYLTTALRVRSGEMLCLPLPVARDIANFVKEAKINGRQFLRLSEEELEAMEVNKLWQTALLSSSRNLRQNVLKGRIWGTTADNEPFPFSSERYNSSSSSLDLSSSARFLIQSEGESTGSARKPRRTRNGRVRGMVDSYERSGSFSSDSSFSDTGIDIDAAKRYAEEELVVHSPIETAEESSSLAVSSENSSPVRRPLPQPPVHPSLKDSPEWEPTMEELLESDGAAMTMIKRGSWGAKAWEEIDLTANVTVKKVTSMSKTDGDNVSGIIRRSVSGRQKSRDERRVVTAIFSPAVEGANLAEIEPRKSEDELVELLKVKEERLEEQVRFTRTLLEVFKRRLEGVEQKVCEMEEAEKQLQAELSRRGRETEELKDKLRSKEDVSNNASSSSNDKNGRKRLNHLDPQSIPALSQYVILVGIGVCAVVLRVVLKKFIGRKLKL